MITLLLPYIVGLLFFAFCTLVAQKAEAQKNYVNVQRNDTIWLKNTLTGDSTRLYPPDTISYQQQNIQRALRYNKAGPVTNVQAKLWIDTVSLSGGSPVTIDISSANFSSVAGIQLTALNNSSTLASMPFLSVKTYTNREIVINVVASNNIVVSALGTTISGLAALLNVVGMKVFVTVYGY